MLPDVGFLLVGCCSPLVGGRLADLGFGASHTSPAEGGCIWGGYRTIVTIIWGMTALEAIDFHPVTLLCPARVRFELRSLSTNVIE